MAIALAALFAAAALLTEAQAQSYGYGYAPPSYGYGSPPPGSYAGAPLPVLLTPSGAKASCTVAFNFTSHADSTYACGDGDTCQVVQVAVTNLEPFAIPFGWALTLSKATWYVDYSVSTWWNCANVKLSYGTLSLNSDAQWQTLAKNGGTEGFGYIMQGISKVASSYAADTATLNGRQCAILT